MKKDTHHRTQRRALAGVFATTVLAAACGGMEGMEGPEGETGDAIYNGAVMTGLPSVVQLVIPQVGTCTGTIVGRRDILTAKHCLPTATPVGTTVLATAYALTDTGAGNFVANVVGVFTHPTFDIEVMKLDRDAPTDALGVNLENINDWTGRRLLVMGNGTTNTGVRTTRGSWQQIYTTSSRVSPVDPENTFLGMSGPNNSHACDGDSGGPNLAWVGGQWKVVGVTVGGDQGCVNPSGATLSVRTDAVASWLQTVVSFRGSIRTPHGNMTGVRALRARTTTLVRNDALVRINPSGLAVQYMGTSGPVTRWTASSAPGWKLGTAEGALADFNGDDVADLLVVDGLGVRVFPGSIGTGDVYSVAAPTSLSPNGSPMPVTMNRLVNGTAQRASFFGVPYMLGNTMVYVGQFDGLRGADVILQTATDAFVYAADATGTFVEGRSLSSRLGRAVGTPDATITVGDFDGDNRSDIIVQYSGGSSLLRGVGTWSTFNGASRPDAFGSPISLNDFARGTAELVPGRFVTSATSPGADLLVMRTSGTRIYYSNGNAFTASSFNRPDLLASETAVVVGDTNGDAFDDVLFQRPDGSYLYQGTGNAANELIANTWSTAEPAALTDFIMTEGDGDASSDLLDIGPYGTAYYRGIRGGNGLSFTYNYAPWARVAQRFAP